MQSSRPITLLLVVALLALCASGCEFFFTSSRSVSRFAQPRSFTTEFAFEVQDNVTPLRLALDLRLAQGEVRWRLVDARGNERWVGEARDQQWIQESRLLDPIVGSWHFSVECHQAAGDFIIEWSGFRRVRP